MESFSVGGAQMSSRPGPLVSIVTPTYNMGRWLSACIASIESQSYPNIEHIVVDGGSTDGTLAVLEQHPNVRWVSEPDRGQSDAINKGLRMAQGDVLGWLNADDELTAGAIARVVNAFAAHPEAGLCYGDLDVVQDGRVERVAPPGEYSVRGMWCSNSLSQPGTFWTREAQALVGEIDESFHLAMDFDLWLRFAHAGVSGVYVPEVQARFPIHEASKSGTAGWVAIAEEEARALRKQGEHHGAAMAINRWFWGAALEELGTAAAEGRRNEVSASAADLLPRLQPVRRNIRWFVRLCRVSPRLAGWAYSRRLARSASRRLAEDGSSQPEATV